MPTVGVEGKLIAFVEVKSIPKQVFYKKQAARLHAMVILRRLAAVLEFGYIL